MFSSFCVGRGVSGRGRRARTISNFLTRDLVKVLYHIVRVRRHPDPHEMTKTSRISPHNGNTLFLDRINVQDLAVNQKEIVDGF